MSRQNSTEILIASAITVLALVVRLCGLGSHFLLIDEAFVGVSARDIAHNTTPMWEAVSNAPYVWVLAQLIQVFGDSPFVLRSLSAIAGASVCLLLFFGLRRVLGLRIAVIACILYALHPFAIAFTRVAFVDALQLPFVLLAILSADRFTYSRSWQDLVVAIVAAMLAFICKYNALAILLCWFAAATVTQRYRLKDAIILLGALSIASLATLLFWPHDATVWFFSFLAKGGSYDKSYIWDFYHYAYRHVVFGVITLPIVVVGYLYARRSFEVNARKLLDATLLFGLLYFALLLFLGRPFQRYLLVLTVPVAIIYASVIANAFIDKRRLISLGIAAAVIIGVLVQGFRSESNYIAYLRNDLDLEQASSSLGNSRVFWPTLSSSIAGYYIGFDQYYSLATRGALNEKMDRHYFHGRTIPYSADTLPYGVLLAKRKLEREGFFSALSNPSEFAAKVKQQDKEIDTRKNAMPLVDYYNSDLVQPGDLLVEANGIVDENGEPMLYALEDSVHAPAAIPTDFELLEAIVGGKTYRDLSYRLKTGQGEIRILRKTDAR